METSFLNAKLQKFLITLTFRIELRNKQVNSSVKFDGIKTIILYGKKRNQMWTC